MRAICRSILSVAVLAAGVVRADDSRFTFKHYAGSDGGTGTEDGKGAAARFFTPVGIATDRDGNVYVADINNDTVRKIEPDGSTTTLAGLARVAGDANGVGAAALFYGPAGTAVDSDGNVYVADILNHTIRKVTPGGAVTLFAGSGFDGALNGVGSKAWFSYPADVAVDAAGNVYVADGGNHLIRKIAPDGTTTTLAGGVREQGFVNGAGTVARFRSPQGVAVDSAGNVYVADTRNDAIRKITPDGTVTTIAGNMSPGREDGPGTTARFYRPTGVTVGNGGNLYVADTDNNLIRKITPAGVVSTIAGGEEFSNSGSADGTGRSARFTSPYDIAADSAGNLYVADGRNDAIRKIVNDSDVTTLAGKAPAKARRDGTLSEARFSAIRDMTIDASGTVYLIDGHVIRKMTAAGVVTTIAGVEQIGQLPDYIDGPATVARFENPSGIAVDGAGNLYVVDRGAHTVRKVAPDGTVSTYAGTIDRAGREDGALRAAQFYFPSDVAIDRDGTMYVSDDCTIRKVTADGNVTTMLGKPVPPARGCFENVDGPFATAKLNSPDNLVPDGKGNLFLTTTQTFGSSSVRSTVNTIRKITPDGFVTTVAGDDAKREAYLDAFGTGARFFNIGSIAVDASGSVYVTEFSAHTIRRVSPEGLVTTIGGVPGYVGTADGTNGDAWFRNPYAIAVDRDGSLLIAESGWRIRVGRPALFDAATIDAIVAVVGGRRQLSTTTRRATTWTWDMTREPSASSSKVSSESIRNPTFVPDLEDLYEFRLTASDAVSESITRVPLLGLEGMATPAGSGISLTAENVTLTFPSVGSAGQTVIVSFDPSLRESLPESKYVWRIHEATTTADFVPPARFCTTLPPTADVRRLSEFSLFAKEGDAFVDRTSSRTAATRTICADLPSLGRIVLGGPLPPRRRPASR